MDLPQLSDGAAAARIQPGTTIAEPARQDARRAGTSRMDSSGHIARESAQSGRQPGWRHSLAAQWPTVLQIAAWIAAIAIVLAIKRFG